MREILSVQEDINNLDFAPVNLNFTLELTIWHNLIANTNIVHIQTLTKHVLEIGNEVAVHVVDNNLKMR